MRKKEAIHRLREFVEKNHFDKATILVDKPVKEKRKVYEYDGIYMYRTANSHFYLFGFVNSFNDKVTEHKVKKLAKLVLDLNPYAKANPYLIKGGYPDAVLQVKKIPVE